MRTRSPKHTGIALFVLVLSTSAYATDLPSRDVRINEERLARLSLVEQDRVLAIRDRLEAIIATDRTALDRTERDELRSEWRDLKGEMKHYNRNGSVIYISTAALIIIILLLILIL